MKITIDEETLDKHKLTKAQLFLLFSLIHPVSKKDLIELENQGLISKDLFSNKYEIVNQGILKVNKIILDSDKASGKINGDIVKLVKDLQELYPKGKKEGTNNYWRGNVPEIKERLLVFFKKFGDFPHDTVIQATQKYIDSFQDNTKLMKTLKYFISKKRIDGNTEYDLLTYIENINTVDEDILTTTKLI